jgi:hypothetical protein
VLEVRPAATRDPKWRLRLVFPPPVGEKVSCGAFTRGYPEPAALVGQTVLAAVTLGTRKLGPEVSEVLVLGVGAKKNPKKPPGERDESDILLGPHPQDNPPVGATENPPFLLPDRPLPDGAYTFLLTDPPAVLADVFTPTLRTAVVTGAVVTPAGLELHLDCGPICGRRIARGGTALAGGPADWVGRVVVCAAGDHLCPDAAPDVAPLLLVGAGDRSALATPDLGFARPGFRVF